MIEQLILVLKYLSPSSVVINPSETHLVFCFPDGETLSIIWGENTYANIDEGKVEILAKRGGQSFVQKGGSIDDNGAQGWMTGAEVVDVVVALLSGEDGEELRRYCKHCETYHTKSNKCIKLIHKEQSLIYFEELRAILLA